MKRNSVLLLFIVLFGLSEYPLAADKALSLRLAGGGSSSIGMLGRYTNMGLGGSMGIGLRPFRDSRDVEFITSVSYDRFPNEKVGLGQYSFVRAGVGVLLTIGSQRPNRVYLVFDGGPAFVRADSNSGFPPYHGQSHKSTNLYGAGGAGLAFQVSRSVSMYVQFELVDILDTLFGDYRFFRLSLGIQI